MSEWQDISTAPKDGSHFLVWDATTKRVCIGTWEDATDEEMSLGADRYFEIFDFETQWAVWDHDVTHWMPLPAKPTTGE